MKKAREEVDSPTVIRAARKAGPNCALYNRGIFAHPAEDFPEAAAEPLASCTFKGKPAEPDTWEFSGTICIDGSCDQHMIEDLRRAGWGAAAINDKGEVLAEAKGVIPADTTQSSQSGEYGALVSVAIPATGLSRILADCLNVVKAWNDPSDRTDVRKAYGSFIKLAKNSPGASEILSVEWVKAHQNLKLVTGDPEKLAHAKGNAAADTEANECRKMHPQPSSEQARKVKHLCWHASAACRVIAATLPHWPRLKHQESENAVSAPAGPARLPRALKDTSGKQAAGGNPSALSASASQGNQSPA